MTMAPMRTGIIKKTERMGWKWNVHFFHDGGNGNIQMVLYLSTLSFFHYGLFLFSASYLSSWSSTGVFTSRAGGRVFIEREDGLVMDIKVVISVWLGCKN